MYCLVNRLKMIKSNSLKRLILIPVICICYLLVVNYTDLSIRNNSWLCLDDLESLKGDTIRNLLMDNGIESIWNEGYLGEGITIAVIDTGIYSHPDLRANIIAFKDFINNKANPYDDNGHGTEISGIIAGSGEKSGGLVHGIAPNAKILALKAVDKDGFIDVSNIEKCINWVVEKKNKYRIKVICLSLGYDWIGSYQSDPLYSSIEKANTNEILVIASAGNDGYITSPGRLPNVVAVGSLSDLTSGTKTLQHYKNKFKQMVVTGKPDFFAPGENIITTRVWNGQERQYYSPVSGSSYSAAIMAGLAAILYQKYPMLTVMEMKQKLKSLSHNNVVYLEGKENLPR